MKGSVKKSIIWILCLLMLLPLAAACKGTPEQPAESGELPVVMTELIKDGKTDYVLVYDKGDLIALDTANRVSEEIYRLSGVSLSMRSDKSEYEKEIVIGAANRAEIAALDASLASEDDFIISYQGNKLFLYAKTAVGAKKMLIALQSKAEGSKEEKRLSIPEGLRLQGSQMPAEQLSGTVLTLASGGATEYKIIYSNSNDDGERIAYFLRSELSRLCGVDIKASTDRVTAEAKELIVGISGECNRDEFRDARELLRGAGDFAITVKGEKLILIASDTDALVRGAEYLVQNVFAAAGIGDCRFSEVEEYCHLINNGRFAVSAERLSYLYSNILDRYPTLYQLYFSKTLTSKEREDQLLCEALIARMGGSAAVCVDKTVVLWNGLIQKLDNGDYSAAASLSGGDDVTVPADFANRYFGAGSAAGAVSLKALAQQKGYTYYYDAANKLAIVSPAEVAGFEGDAQASGGYTDLQYRNRMAQFFSNPAMPEPSNDTEQSRVVIEDAVDYYPADSLDYQTPTYTSYYSPAVLTVKENGNTVIYAANERSQIQNGAELSTVTMIRKSTDGGATWQDVARVPDIRWATLIEVNGTIYGIGSKAGVGLHIFRLGSDGSVTLKLLWWTNERNGESGAHEALIEDGILYAPLDEMVASVPIDQDIMNPENWTKTQRVSSIVTQSWFESATGKKLSGAYELARCQEGNMVKGKDGKLYAIYRIESMPYGNYAVMLELSADRTTLQNPRAISLPTTVSRFVIKYDEESGYYICISNLWTVTDSRDTCRARNVLGLSVSTDLVNWTVADTLLVDRTMMNSTASCWAHSYQYVDWDFDGDDLVMTVREATGFTNTFHDGKYFTFYRVTDFRSLL